MIQTPEEISSRSILAQGKEVRRPRRKFSQSLRVHNAMVTDRMQSGLNRLRAAIGLGHKPCLREHEDRNALAFHYIESGAIKRFSTCHRINVKAA